MSAYKPRKRERTRDRLVVAAQELMLERPASTISIADVAERADVVHATFYNYYKTREELITDCGAVIFAHYARAIERVIAGMEDAAEILAASMKQTLRYITHEPTYPRLLFDAGLPVDRYLMGMRLRFQHDLSLGVRQGVFKVTEPELAMSMVAGATLGVAIDIYRGHLPPRVIPELVYRTLASMGVNARRARAIADRDIELVPTEPLPASWIALRAAEAADEDDE